MLAEDLWRLFDIIGTLAFAVSGTLVGISRRMDIFGISVLALATAVGGGMIRDIATGSIPSIFGGNTLYATPAIFSSAIMVGFHAAGHDAVGMIAATTLGAGFAILAYWRGWVLPTVIEQEQARRRRKAGKGKQP